MPDNSGEPTAVGLSGAAGAADANKAVAKAPSAIVFMMFSFLGEISRSLR
jgi:hypothetical protein